MAGLACGKCGCVLATLPFDARTYLVGQIAAALIARPSGVEQEAGEKLGEAVTRHAVQMADYLLAELAKPKV